MALRKGKMDVEAGWVAAAPPWYNNKLCPESTIFSGHSREIQNAVVTH